MILPLTKSRLYCIFCCSARDQYLELHQKIKIATSALPDQIEELFTKTISVGKSFGVINNKR